MSRKDRRKNSLSKLAAELNIVESEQTPLSKDAEYQKSYHRIYRTGEKPGEDAGVPDMTTEVIIDTRGDAMQLMRFMKKLDLSIHEGAESYGGILRTSYLWDGCVSITIMLEPEKLSELMIRLSALPEVEKVEDELFAREITGEEEKKFRDLPYPPVAKANNKIRITLHKSMKAE